VNIPARLIALLLLPFLLAVNDGDSPEGHSKKVSTPAAHRAKWVPHRPGVWNHVLRMARSADGLKFHPDDGVVIRYANGPALTRWPQVVNDGRTGRRPLQAGANDRPRRAGVKEQLLLVFEFFSRENRRDFGRLGYSLSKDAGKTWSSPKPLTIRRLHRSAGRPRGPALAMTPAGALQLYFTCEDRKGRQTIFLAEPVHDDTPDTKGAKGKIEFSIRARIRTKDKRLKLEDVAVADIGGRLHLYATRQSQSAGLFHGTFSTPMRIGSEELIGTKDLGAPGSIVRTDDTWRLYATTTDRTHRLEIGATAGIISATSTDGLEWTPDDGLRLIRAVDPAVVRLADKSYLMIYVERPPTDREDSRLSTEGGRLSLNEQDQLSTEEFDDFASWYASVDDQGSGVDEGLDAGAEEADSSALLDGELENKSPDGDAELAENLEDDADQPSEEDDDEPLYCLGDVPVPDFKHYVDYRAWMEGRYAPDGVAANAYDDYAAFMPMPGDELGDKPAWPQFSSMFHDADHVGPPGPWDPAEHPAWEATFLASAELEQRYAQAAAVIDYVPRLLWAQPGPQEEAHDRDSQNLLLNFMLPTLRSHRSMTKQILGDAWRAPGGRLDPQRMLDAFDTTLGGAEHLVHGDFLIQSLVSVAQKRLIEKNAIWALKDNVFSADQMESALEIFIEKDRHLPDLGDMLKGELAASLDYSQYVFGPIEPNRKPTLNPARAAYISEMNSDPPPTEAQVAAADPHRTVETFVDYYDRVAEMMRRGYPEVRPEDIRQLEQAAVQDNYAVRTMLPRLSRYYQLINRSEASRRATQLSYAIHLYKARNGQWPTSLEDLPPRYTQDVRTDPFSGEDFVYRVTQNGPLLYSTSENGRDDGGLNHPRWGDNNKDDDQGDDHVFWPPQRR